MQSSVDLTSPPEAEESILRRRTTILWLVAIGTALLLVPLYLASATIGRDAEQLQGRLEVVQQTLRSPAEPERPDDELAGELSEVQARLNEVKAAASDLEAQNIDWPAVMAAIGNYNPAQMALSSVETGSSITLRGLAVDDRVVVDYTRELEQSNLFSRVVIQSLEAVATPFATLPPESPDAPLTPTLPLTPTATPVISPTFQDPYEVDDFSPVPILLGVPQERSFDPLFDVDRVKFLAKAGRTYRVATYDLWPGVDTFLTVMVGGRTYTNDDVAPGTLRSEVVFTGGAIDHMAQVRITNRGQYGPNMRYTVMVEEVIVEEEIPATPTPTPDLRDEYEPDDIFPSPIAVGETQLRNFYPEGDIDKAEFLAKAGRWYRVYTSDLALGVDTFLAVMVDGAVYTNDDRAPGDLSSEILFRAGPTDALALVKITNRGQYGPQMTYRITVEEHLPEPTPSPVPTVTPTPIPQASPTPDLRDPYEPNDEIPNPIAVGETQTHNFYPEGDIDNVEFLAKAGRWYRVYTSNLDLKVDTHVEVTLRKNGAILRTFVNDDRAPGDLSSEVVFNVDLDHDVIAWVRITNQGQYGPDRVYDITVEEVFPDLMAVGETRERIFGHGAEDRVRFVPRQGHHYAVTTSDLALGVDTYIRVIMGGDILAENDNYMPGTHASRVEFEAPSSDTAVVLISNRQGLYGPGTSYRIHIEELSTADLPPSRGPGLAADAVRNPDSGTLSAVANGRVATQHLSPQPVSFVRVPEGQAVRFVIFLELAR